MPYFRGTSHGHVDPHAVYQAIKLELRWRDGVWRPTMPRQKAAEDQAGNRTLDLLAASARLQKVMNSIQYVIHMFTFYK